MENGEGGTEGTKEDGAVMEELEPENEDVTKGERDEKSIVAVRDSCCVTA